MELKKDGVLFINLIFRVVSLIAFVSEYESPVLPMNKAVLNWNEGVTARLVLVLANGLRDDFLEENKTRFLQGIAAASGSFARVAVEEIFSIEGSLRCVLTGLPWHGALLPWNRPAEYNTILDHATCKCVIGWLPLKKPVECQLPGRNQSEVFENFREMNQMDCLYVLSFDFGGTSEGDYLRMLLELDEEMREVTQKWTETTWVLTSSRGWSAWNRRDGRVDAPLLAWGRGILPKRDVQTIGLTDVPAFVNTLLGRTFPAGCLAKVPTYLIAADDEAKFHMALYNFEHLERTLGSAEEDEYEGRNLSGMIDEGNTMSLELSVDNFLEMVRGLRTSRMRIFTIVAVVCFGIWSAVFVSVVFRGSLPFNFVLPIIVIAVAGVIVYLQPRAIYVAAMVLLTPMTLLSLSDVVKSFHAEAHRVFFLSLLMCLLCGIFIMMGNHATIVFLLTPIGLWPVLSRVANGMNRKILLSWFVSAVVLATLSFSNVFGRDRIPDVTILSSVLHVALFHLAYHSFKRRVGHQGWIITVAVLSSTYLVYFSHLWHFPPSMCLISWCFLLHALISTFTLRGTLLERHLKFHLVLLIPMQLLSNHHEALFHVSLATHMFCWVFIEHASTDKSILSYNPSIFNLERPSELTSDSLQLKHCRRAVFFLAYNYISFFAVGNLPAVYTYEYSILKPFCNLYPFILLPLKLILPPTSILYTFLTIYFTQRTDPSSPFILSIHFSDVISSCFLLCTFFSEDNIFALSASHYIILQTASASLTGLYLLCKYAFFLRKT